MVIRRRADNDRPDPVPPVPGWRPDAAAHRGSAAELIRLQRDAGNQAVVQRMRRTKQQAPAQWRTKEVGGFDLSWDPYGEKTLERYATQQEYDAYQARHRYVGTVIGGSANKAVWFRTVGGVYDAEFAASRPWKLTVTVTISEDTPFIHHEADTFKGEAQHPGAVIVKNGEIGAYGIGRELMDRLDIRWASNKK